MSFRSVLIASTVLAAWSAGAAAEVIKVGFTPGPHAQILEAVKPIAARKGLDIQLIEFSDYVVPNAALDAGELQANSFQNQPYLDSQKADRGYKIESVGLTVNFPIGVYSRKHKSWSDIPNGGTVSIPNDPTNGGRVLLLMRDKEVIKLGSASSRRSLTSRTIRRSSSSSKSMPRSRRVRSTTSMPQRSTPTTPPRRGLIPSRTRSFAKIRRGRTSI